MQGYILVKEVKVTYAADGRWRPKHAEKIFKTREGDMPYQRTYKYRLIRTKAATFVLIIDEHKQRVLHNYHIIYKTVRGRLYCIYADAVTGEELFPGKHFDDAWLFHEEYAPVVINGRYCHIDMNGKIAYPWRFSDFGQNENGVVLVQHPRARGWSKFDIRRKVFLTNPPRYRQ